MLSPSILVVTDTDAMDAYLTGGVDRTGASGTRIMTAAATTSTTTTTSSTTAQTQLSEQPP